MSEIEILEMKVEGLEKICNFLLDYVGQLTEVSKKHSDSIIELSKSSIEIADMISTFMN